MTKQEIQKQIDCVAAAIVLIDQLKKHIATGENEILITISCKILIDALGDAQVSLLKDMKNEL